MSAMRRTRATAAMVMAALLFAAPACAGAWRWGKKKGPKGPVAESLDTYLQKVNAMGATVVSPARGSLWAPGASWGDLSTDYKAREVGDLVTILLA
ncbi:MAG: flagellar basal body L-ring protein FlgH, partial [Acidobacteriota bacterium]|nr:flagellar basal body L-ring protein FlgH [Acidobacteriota bacterium]